MLRANIELADRTDESADDITAAETAPRPMNVTQGGHRYCITIGRIIFSSPAGSGMRFGGRSVCLQSVQSTDTRVVNPLCNDIILRFISILIESIKYQQNGTAGG